MPYDGLLQLGRAVPQYTIFQFNVNFMSKNVKKSDDLFDLHDVSVHFGLSESSIRRRVRASRNGESNFPLPLFGSGCRVLWKKSAVLAWAGEDSETIDFNPSMVPSMPQAPTLPTSEQVRAGLARHGIILPPVAGSR